MEFFPHSGLAPWIGNDDQSLFGAENSWAEIENDGQSLFGAGIRWQGCLQTPALLELAVRDPWQWVELLIAEVLCDGKCEAQNPKT